MLDNAICPSRTSQTTSAAHEDYSSALTLSSRSPLSPASLQCVAGATFTVVSVKVDTLTSGTIQERRHPRCACHTASPLSYRPRWCDFHFRHGISYLPPRLATLRAGMMPPTTAGVTNTSIVRKRMPAAQLPQLPRHRLLIRHDMISASDTSPLHKS